MVINDFMIDSIDVIKTEVLVEFFYINEGERITLAKWDEEDLTTNGLKNDALRFVKLFFTDKNKFVEKLTHEFGLELSSKVTLDQKAFDLINHMNEYFYIWFEKESNEERRKLLNRLIYSFQNSGINDPSDFMVQEGYDYDAEVVKVASFLSTGIKQPNFAPSYQDLSEVKEDLFSTSDLDGEVYDKDVINALNNVSYLRIEKF